MTSAPGQGAAFNIYLPAVPSERKQIAVEEPAVDPKGTETILLVEDEEDLRTVCAGYLRSQGYKVLEACDGTAGLAICNARREPIDLMVTDVIMPRMNGTELSKIAKGIYPTLRTIFISGYSDTALDTKTIQPNDAYLQKPFSMRSLAREIRAALDRTR